MAMRCNDKWAFIEDDPELDEEAGAARREASELREQANALAHHAQGLKEGELRRARLCEAVAMYRRADTCICRVAAGRRLLADDKQLVLECRLNAACLALEARDEAACGRICGEALELDAENPHAALFQARAAARRDKAKEVEHWLERARRWARQRGEEGLLQEVEEVSRRILPPPAEREARKASGVPAPREWVRQGVALLKQRRGPEARPLLERAVEVLDSQEHGGPVERHTQRAPRALAFDALEALSEVHAAQGDLQEARRCGERALALLEPGPAEAPFAEPDAFVREGLLLFSLGHVAAYSGGDPLPSWRRAVTALERHKEGEVATEGQVLFELGVWQADRAMPEQGAYDVDIVEEAALALEHASDRFSRARSRLTSDADAARRAEMARRELQAHATLAGLLCSLGETFDAGRILEASAYLLDSAPERPLPAQAEDWAAPCGKWALAATKVGRLAEAEKALLQQQRLGCAASNADTQLDALKALAVVRRRRRNDGGVDEVLASIAELTPESKRDGELRRIRRMLRQVAPDPEPVAAAANAGTPALPAPAPPTVVGVGGLRRRAAEAAPGPPRPGVAAAAPAPPARRAAQTAVEGHAAPWWRRRLPHLAALALLAALAAVAAPAALAAPGGGAAESGPEAARAQGGEL